MWYLPFSRPEPDTEVCFLILRVWPGRLESSKLGGSEEHPVSGHARLRRIGVQANPEEDDLARRRRVRVHVRELSDHGEALLGAPANSKAAPWRALG